MPGGKATALTAGIFAAFVVGAWLGPHLNDRAQASGEPDTHVVSEASAPVVEPTSSSDGLQPSTQPATPPPVRPWQPAAKAVTSLEIPISTADLHRRLKPLLNAGADIDTVAAGFKSLEDFAATVHAARNTRVQVMLLKHEVVDQGKTLAAAIKSVKPSADASLEADLARSEARADLESLK